ncbi:hypothetical protein [Jannaschia sp. W003]|uniref:hypothetical protein n=1 Tax=Jannaschia sp. W003 TaxID=2867012 RepID=UPI0021A840DF|nr:hypothetical protein [Jannaschia sp. W003]UWQ22519.1 hypothetical protein K3554_05705 [Jannaschia sp. W003]
MSHAPDPPDDAAPPIHVLRPSPARRAIALGIQIVLGLLLLWIALAQPPEALLWRVVLLALGGGALVLGLRGWQGGAQGIVLDAGGLRTEDGRTVAALANIASVDRGVFAFKPSNGFLLRLHEPMPRAWSPGMWWRVGRRVGVGGVISPSDAKFAADVLAMRVAERP